MIALTVVLSLVGFVLVWQKQSSSQAANRNGGSQLLLNELRVEDLATIRIRGAAAATELRQEEGGWKVESSGWPADAQKVRELLLSLLQAQLGDEVTRNPEHHPRLELVDPEAGGEGTAIRLELIDQQQQPVLELLLGKSRDQGGGRFVRFVGEETAYLTPEELRVSSTEIDWMQTELFSLGDGTFTALEVNATEEENFRLKRAEETNAWQLEDMSAAKLNAGAVNRIDQALRRLQFEEWMPETTDPVILGRQTVREVTGFLNDGRVLKLSLGSKEVEGRYWLSVALQSQSDNRTLQQEVKRFNKRTQPWIFGVRTSAVAGLLQERAELLEQP